MAQTKTPSTKTTSKTRRTKSRLSRWWSARRRSDGPTREPVDVVSQFQAARRQPWAAGLAGLVGGLPPFIGQAMAHAEVGSGGVVWHHDPKALVVAGCMLFSMTTLYVFGRATFRDAKKAVGFVGAMELAMVASGLWYVRLATLVTVIAVNMVMTGAGIALAYEAAQKRREADGRRQATRAQTRAEQRQARRGVAPVSAVQGRTPISVASVPVAPPAWTQAPSALVRRPRVTTPARRGAPIDVSAVEYDDARLS